MPSSTTDTDFESHAPGYWPAEAMEHWDDYKWQLRNRIDTLADLESRLELTDVERAGALLAGSKLAMSITPHFFNLIDPNDPNCPIRRQVIPRLEEGWKAPEEFNALLGKIRSMPNSPERSAAFQRALDIFDDEAPGTPLYRPYELYGIQSSIGWSPVTFAWMELRPHNLAFD